MFTRQKTLIYLLKLAGRPVSRTELTKWCFLLRHEFESKGGNAFYDFVPYQFGPFSFLLYQEADKLVAQGYLKEHDNTWFLNEHLAGALPAPGAAIERDSLRLVSRFQSYAQDKLIEYVYERFPAYTVNSKLRRLATRSVAELAVYTSGYEGLTVDAFLNRLVAGGISRLVDVRNNPIARRYGFHKSTLKRLTGRLEIDYVHFPELGIHSRRRQDLGDQASYDALFDDYEKTTLEREERAISEVSSLALEAPSVLVCMEADPACCHRSRLAERVSHSSQLPIVHLQE